jgi:hypothetical protein
MRDVADYNHSPKTSLKINKAKATFTGRSPRHNQATTAGHLEGIKPKPGEDIRALKGGGGHVICEIIKT